MDLNHRAGRPGPLRDGRDVVSERGVVDLVDEDPEESCGFIVWVGLQLGVELDDECGGNCREQTSLPPQLKRVHETHAGLTKVRVVSRSFPYLLRKSLSYSLATPRYFL